MLYRIYAYCYEYGWELYDTAYKQKEVNNIVNNIDRYEYGQYIVIKETDRDEVIDTGNFKKPKIKKKNKWGGKVLYEEYELYKNKYYEVQKKYNDILNEKEELFAKTQPKAVQIKGEKTSGGKHTNTFDDYLIQKEKKNIDKRLEEVRSILDDRGRLVKLKEQELRASNNSHDKIYRCRYIDRLTIEKTARISNYSRSQVFNILKEIRSKLK